MCALHYPRCCCEFWCWQLYFLLHFTGHFPFLYVTAFVWACCDCMCVFVCVCVRLCACNFLIFFASVKIYWELATALAVCPATLCSTRWGQRKVKLKLKLKKEEEMAAIPLCVRACVWVQLKLTCRQRIRLLTNTSVACYINAAAVQMAKFMRET